MSEEGGILVPRHSDAELKENLRSLFAGNDDAFEQVWPEMLLKCQIAEAFQMERRTGEMMQI